MKDYIEIAEENIKMADKKEFHFFVLPEYEEEEKYLCDMAKKGYLFEKVTLPGVYHFKKSEPTNMIYRIDFNPQKKENRESYLQMFKDYGWEYIQDLNEFSYFCKLDDGTDDDIFMLHYFTGNAYDYWR